MKRITVWLSVLAMALAVTACGPERDESGALTEAQDVSATDVEVGDCFNAAEGESITDVGGVPCDEPHVYEVYALPQHADGEFPGDGMQAKAEELCVAEFEGYVGIGYDESEWLLTTINPSAETWEEGDRETICALHAEGNAEVTGSARDSAK